MFQKIHPQCVILVPNLRLMWEDKLKKLQQFRPYIKKSMGYLGYPKQFAQLPYNHNHKFSEVWSHVMQHIASAKI